MSMEREEAERALAEIGEAQDKMWRIYDYADAAPFLILWGAIWAFANLAAQFAPAWSDAAWLAGMAVGIPVTLYFSIVQARRRGPRIRQAGGDAKAAGKRFCYTMAAIMLFFAGVFAVAGPLDGRQANALISLFWACLYLGVGAWVGARLMLIGAATAGVILFAYFALDQHYHLAMGLGAGGGLIAGGLWLRKL